MTDQIKTSAKKTRGLARNTLALRADILDMIRDDEIEPPFTVRQAYYRLVVLGCVDKAESAYGRVQRELLRLRREGYIPYHYMTDNSRLRRVPDTHDDLYDALTETARFYRQSTWRDLDVYVEVWCEKDALGGVINPVTSEYNVPLLSAKGYSSEGFCYSAAEEMKAEGATHNFVYALGDFDPSGWDATRTLQEKLQRFKPDVVFERIAVNEDHLDSLEAAHRETKGTDSRAKRFFQRFGRGTPSVELDAIPPSTLRQMIREKIEQHIPPGHLEQMRIEEQEAKRVLMEMRRHVA